MRDVEIDPIALDRLASLLDPPRVARIWEYAEHARALLGGRTVWNVNATAQGGGVAEMLQALLSYARGAGVETRWLVLDGIPEFFRLTKRLHNNLHGATGDGGPLGDEERKVYEQVLAENLEFLRTVVRTGDVVLLHDPQSAGLVAGLRELGAHVVWRCHIGRDSATELTDAAWEFLRRYIQEADAVIFSRRVYAPFWVDPARLWLIAPSLDPFSAKNCELPKADVSAALRQAGLAKIPQDSGSLSFVGRSGAPGEVRRHDDLILAGGPLPGNARVVLQVSRWDRLKDMTGVLTGFADRLPLMPEDVHLMLVGPEVSGVTDDPEGAEVLAECLDLWRSRTPDERSRIHLCSLPMDDVDENAHLVNALQRHADVVVQKSLVEGFGLTVTEPMWKGRPVVASKVGGIQDQIVDGVSGLLLPDPTDLDMFGDLLLDVLHDDELARRLGTAARERVRDMFIGDRHLIQYVDLFDHLITGA